MFKISLNIQTDQIQAKFEMAQLVLVSDICIEFHLKSFKTPGTSPGEWGMSRTKSLACIHPFFLRSHLIMTHTFSNTFQQKSSSHQEWNFVAGKVEQHSSQLHRTPSSLRLQDFDSIPCNAALTDVDILTLRTLTARYTKTTQSTLLML